MINIIMMIRHNGVFFTWAGRRDKPMTTARLWTVGNTLIALLVALPLLAVVYALFSPASEVWQHLYDTLLWRYLGNTLLLMFWVGIIATIIGVGSAWLIAAYDFPGKRLLSWALMLPMAAPAYITAYTYTDLLDYAGPIQSLFRHISGLGAGQYPELPIRSLGGAALILALVLYPYIYLITRAAFTQRSHTLFEAARTLGASPTKAFWRVALPAARPAIAAGLALVLMETLADYGVVDYFGIPTFSTGIFRTWLAMGEKQAAIKLAAVMLLVVIALVAFEKYSRRGQVSGHLNRDAKAVSLPLSGIKAWLATLSCALPVVLGALIPIAVLAKLAIKDPDLANNLHYTANTLRVCAYAVLITLAAALLLNLSQRYKPSALGQGLTLVATLGYALPGALLAIGLLSPLTGFDRWFAGIAEQHFNWQPGLLLTGSLAVLVYAYVVRFLTVAYGSIGSGLAQIPKAYDETARSLGASPRRLFRAVHLPLLKRSITVAALLVFVDCVRELPATLLLRPFNFETLATRVYRLASDERLTEAATASLLIIVIGLIPVILLSVEGRKTSA